MSNSDYWREAIQCLMLAVLWFRSWRPKRHGDEAKKRAARVKRLEEALLFYSDHTGMIYTDDQNEDGSWNAPSLVIQDGGELARKALEGK